MNRDGKITDGTGWVNRPEDADVLVAVLERWVFLNGSAPLAPDIEYNLRHKGGE